MTVEVDRHGCFKAGSFAGGVALNDHIADMALPLSGDEVCALLDLAPEHLVRVLDGRAPLPVLARYLRLLEELETRGEPLAKDVLYTWVSADQRTWSKTKGTSTTTTNTNKGPDTRDR